MHTISSCSYDMEGHAKKCWRIKQRNNYTKSQRHALMTINSKKKKKDQLEISQQFAHKLFRNVHTWLVLVDLIFYGP